MAEPLSIVILSVTGTPRPQPRPRIHNGGVAKLEPYQQAWFGGIVAKARGIVKHERIVKPGPAGISVALSFRFGTKQRHLWGQRHTARPDADNLAKLALDAFMAGGLLFEDDSLVADLRITKTWDRVGGMDAAIDYAPAQYPWREISVQVGGNAPGWLSRTINPAAPSNPARPCTPASALPRRPAG